MQILEHEQHRRGGGALGEQRERLLEHPQLRAGACPSARQGSPSGRSASTNGWYGSSVPTRSIERPSRTSNPASRARLRELGREPGLADARLSGDEDGRAAPRPRRVERALELPELACASDEHLARASLHSGQYRAATPGGRRS